MRILVLSDLHPEVWGERVLQFDMLVSSPDLVVLAGDIHTAGRAPAWAAQAFSKVPVLYIAGNHEFYGDTIEGADEVIRAKCEDVRNVRYLNCDEFTYDGVRFLGCTLWTDFGLFNPNRIRSAMLDARASLNDYQRIRVASAGHRRLHPQDTARIHASHRAWLDNKLAEPFFGHTVVLTHMAPSFRSVAQKYASDPVSAAFASNLDNMVERANVWIQGHTYTSVDYCIKRCRLVANPLGYLMRTGRAENESFDPNFVVSLDC